MLSPLFDNAPAREGFRVVRPPETARRPEPFAGYGDLLSVRDLCALTGLSAQTVRAACASGQLPAVKIGRAWFCPKSRLAEYVGAC